MTNPMAEAMCLKCFEGHPESDRKKYGKFHYYKQKAAKKRPLAHRGNPSADTIIPPMAEDELDRILLTHRKEVFEASDIRGSGTKLKAIIAAHNKTKTSINTYTTNKIIEQVEAIYDEYAFGAKDEFEFGKWLKAKLAELKGKL